MITRTTQVTLMKEDGSTFDEGNYVLTIDDEAAGEYVKVVYQLDEECKIYIEPSDWPELRTAIDTMINYCKESK